MSIYYGAGGLFFDAPTPLAASLRGGLLWIGTAPVI